MDHLIDRSVLSNLLLEFILNSFIQLGVVDSEPTDICTSLENVSHLLELFGAYFTNIKVDRIDLSILPQVLSQESHIIEVLALELQLPDSFIGLTEGREDLSNNAFIMLELDLNGV